MKNTKKKGFTLVELLVVIAILAILATISVVGYTAFVDSANESKAVTELTQVKTLVRSQLMVNDVTVTKDKLTSATMDVVISMDANGLVFKYTDGNTASDAHKTEALKKLIEADVDFEDKLAVNSDGDVTYTNEDGELIATWDVSADSVG